MVEQFQDLSKFILPNNFRGRPGWYVQLWWLVQTVFFNCSPQFMYGWRRFLLRLFGAKVGTGVLVRPTVRITFPWKVELCENCWIGDDVVLYSLGEIYVGKNAVISQKSYICTGTHDYKSVNFDILAVPIVIGEQAWVATDVFIAPGVTVGRAAVIGARSSVFKDVPEKSISVGSPAKVVGWRG